jgi:hypothetical protein
MTSEGMTRLFPDAAERRLASMAAKSLSDALRHAGVPEEDRVELFVTYAAIGAAVVRLVKETKIDV